MSSPALTWRPFIAARPPRVGDSIRYMFRRGIHYRRCFGRIVELQVDGGFAAVPSSPVRTMTARIEWSFSQVVPSDPWVPARNLRVKRRPHRRGR